MNSKAIVVLICTFLILAISIFLLGNTYPDYEIKAIQVANFILFAINIVSFLLISRKKDEKRTQPFINSVYAATLFRLMFCMGAIFVYAYTNRDHLHKNSIFTMMGLYLIYSGIESFITSRIAKRSHTSNSTER